MKKQLINWSNMTTLVLGILLVVLFFSPQAKALMIEGLMKIGLFQPPTANTTSTPAGNPANATPDMILKSADGKTINIKDLKGKVLFINFWATWCPPCIAEMPSINDMYTRFKNNPNVLILAVDVDNDFSRSVPFMQKNQYILPVYNMAGELPEGFLSGAIPTTVIIDKEGTIVARHEGGADYTNAKFIAYLDALSKK